MLAPSYNNDLVDTHMDIIIRRIGVYVQTAYTDKISKDLILGIL
jgi:hypothetical protein